MNRRAGVAALVAATVAGTATLLSGQALFVRPRGFFVAPGATVTLPIVHGTFAASATAIAAAHLSDLSRLGPAGRTAIDRASWTAGEPRSTVRVAFDGPGTYVVGVALAAHPITHEGAAFDRALQDERLTPILDRRRAIGRVGTRVRALRTLAAKTMIAVTDANGHLAVPARERASAALTPLGYAAEIVPLVDPYTVGVGGIVPVRALVAGQPLAGWPIRAGGSIGTSTASIPAQSMTTDRGGRADVRLTHDGHWYVSLVHVADGERGAGVDYVTRGASLTFGVMPN